jgi:hypothetical protein
MLPCDYDEDVNRKETRFQIISGTISRTRRKETTTDIKLKFHEIMILLMLLYGNVSWTVEIEG